MVLARAEVLIERSADEVWARIGNFVDVSWIPNTESCHLEGDVRNIRMKGANYQVLEQLLHHDDVSRSYSYRLVEFESIFGPGGKVTGLLGAIAVEPCGPTSSRVTFDVETDEIVVRAVNEEYQGALDNLKLLMEA